MRRLFIFLSLAFLLVSCENSPKVKSYKDAEREFIASLSYNDSLQVVSLVSDFFSLVRDGRTDEALDMLNVVDNYVLYKISDESKDMVRPLYSNFPETGWKLVRYSFSTPGINDLVCDYGGLNITFNPVKVDSTWFLTLKDGSQSSHDLHTRDQVNPNSPAPYPIRLNRR